MKNYLSFTLLLVIILAYSCKTNKDKSADDKSVKFPEELVSFSPSKHNPVFQGTHAETWDKDIRERGYILYEDGLYRMWYTGYNDSLSELRYLGYATSNNGIDWERHSDKPLVENNWIEDMHVIKHNGLYYMMAEGRNDITHLLTSKDGVEWYEKGDIKILKTNGEPIDEGPYGTPTIWIEDGVNYLFYERNDLAIWLAKSEDFMEWTNVQDDPVLERGPEEYDKGAVAANQILKYNGRYYMYYHASTSSDWMDPNAQALWSSNIAVSSNLLDWEKYDQNPIVEGDHSSPIVVYDEKKKEYILYTMHDIVWRYNPQ